MKQNLRGFTLVELSIVLVIIGLIVGGIVGGQSLIRSAQLNKIVGEVKALKVALTTYGLQYDAMPGDHVDAAEYFANCYNPSSQPCNGNGDNNVDIGSEHNQAWQHLSRSDIVAESYSGFPNQLPGENKPESVASGGAGYGLTYDTVYGKSANSLVLAINGSLDWNLGALLTKEAKAIDAKMDDGKADSGSVITTNGHQETISSYPDQQTCVTAHKNATASDYILSNQNRSCTMLFYID